MKNYTINDFWKSKFAKVKGSTAKPVKGWVFACDGLPIFKEAPSLNSELSSDCDPNTCAILLVSAPGAVGKSTLARQIAHSTGAIYIDLAEADPVGSNALVGGLVKSGLYPQWEAETTAILIDGLDEARLRVTQEAFQVFLEDLAELSKGRSAPIVLFGRTGAVQEAWLILSDKQVETAVLEIGYYGPEASVDFAQARLSSIEPEARHKEPMRRALELLLAKLRQQTEDDGDRFAGYAPVLQAVADRVVGVANPAALVAELERGEPVPSRT
jgi:hypothetical protein